MVSEGLNTLFWLAFMTEFLTETIRQNIPYADKLPSGAVSSGIGILLCCLTETGVLGIVGNFTRAPAIDYFLTGLIISRGSGVVHDFIAALTGFARSFARRI